MKEKLIKLKDQLAQEGSDTKYMMMVYRKVLCGTATEEEIDTANDQFKDVLKSVGLLGLFAIPGGALIIPVAIKVASKLGINLLPSAFNKEESKNKETKRQNDESESESNFANRNDKNLGRQGNYSKKNI